VDVAASEGADANGTKRAREDDGGVAEPPSKKVDNKPVDVAASTSAA
jgi:hypothetical protein